MRKLNTNDVFAALRLVSNTGLRARVKTLLANLKDMKDIDLQSVGIDGFLRLHSGWGDKYRCLDRAHHNVFGVQS